MPDHATAAYDAYRRGCRLLDEREFHQAGVALERARRLEPDKASVREALGRAYLLMRADAKAEREFRVAVDLAPTDGYAHYGLAKALERLGDLREAAVHRKLARLFGFSPARG